MKSIIVAALALLLTGCASFGAQWENRASCSPQGDKLYFHSIYWRFGVTSFVTEEDSRALCTSSERPAEKPSRPPK